jgi:ribosomal protein S18 acetylase RimI-like enzyme
MTEGSTPLDRIVVRKAAPDEIAAVAKIHFEALPDDFLPSLGLDFLESVYYPAAFTSSCGANLVAVAVSRPIGFVTIAHDTRGFSRDVLKRTWLPTARYALRAASRDPRHLIASAQVLRSAVSWADPVAGEIVLIAVDRAFRGMGAGKALVGASMAYLAEHHVDRCRTKTLARNSGVIEMYGGLGWHVRDRFHLIGKEYVTIVSPRIL